MGRTSPRWWNSGGAFLPGLGRFSVQGRPIFLQSCRANCWGWWVYSSGVGPGRLTDRGRGLLLGQQWAGFVWSEMGVACLADRPGAGPGPRPQSGPPGLSLPAQSGGLGHSPLSGPRAGLTDSRCPAPRASAASEVGPAARRDARVSACGVRRRRWVAGRAGAAHGAATTPARGRKAR